MLELRQISRYDPAQEQLGDPVGLTRLVLAHSLIHGTASSQLQRFFANVPDKTDDAFDSGLPLWIDMFHKELSNRRFPPDRMADCVTEFDFAATESGTDCYRVAVKHRGVPSLSWTAIVLRGELGLRLFRTDDQQSELGRHALHLLEKGQEDEARRWLDWAYDQQRQDTSAFARLFDQFTGSPFARLWAIGKQDQRDVQLAAAALAVMGESPQQAIAILEANRADLDAGKGLQVDRALAFGYRKAGDYQRLALLAASVRKQYPRSFEPAALELAARARLQDIDAIEKLVEEYADMKEISRRGQLMLASAATEKGDGDKATAILSTLRQQQDSSFPAPETSRTAWLSLFQSPVPDGTLALAEVL